MNAVTTPGEGIPTENTKMRCGVVLASFVLLLGGGIGTALADTSTQQCTAGEASGDCKLSLSVDLTAVGVFDTAGSTEDVREMLLGLDGAGVSINKVAVVVEDTVFKTIFGKGTEHIPIPVADWDRLVEMVDAPGTTAHDACTSPRIHIANTPRHFFTRNSTGDYLIGEAFKKTQTNLKHAAFILCVLRPCHHGVG